MNFHNAEFIASYGKYEQIPDTQAVEIAFSGRSNVGKSTLINKILNRRNMARTSSMPGKTATINMFNVDGTYLVDLPGYGYAKVSKTEKSKWASLIEGYLINGENLQLVFQLVDFRHPPTKDDITMINFLIHHEIPFVVVLTKADKLSKTQREKRRLSLPKELPYADLITMVEFSSTTGEGVEQLQEIITEISDSE